MLIQCTKKLLDELKIKPEASDGSESPLFSWHANVITLDRRKTVVLMNDSNRYTIVLYGLKAKNFRDFDTVIRKAIHEMLQFEYVRPEIVERYMEHAAKIAYAPTKDRRVLGCMNNVSQELPWHADARLNEGTIYQPRLGAMISESIVPDANGQYFEPNKAMYKDLEVFAGLPVFSGAAAELKVTLALEKFEVWRRLVVPLSITFEQFHDVLQLAFGWLNYHLHKFVIFDGERELLKLVDNEEAFEYPDDIERKMETGIRLSEYVPRYSKVEYNYDFGDGWRHCIEVERVIKGYDKNYPVCLAGVGNTPPEDVGGESGYENFREIVANPKHHEYQEILAWAQGQRYQNFGLDAVNRRLAKSLKGYSPYW